MSQILPIKEEVKKQLPYGLEATADLLLEYMSRSKAWKQAGWAEPVLENRLEVDEVSLVLPIKRIEGSAPKIGPKNCHRRNGLI